MTESFVSLNIVDYKTQQLLNKHNFPLLFYYNGDDNINEKLLENREFANYLCDICVNNVLYTTAEISYFFFDNSGDEEKYVETSISVQDLFTIDKLPPEHRKIAIHYVFDIFRELHEMALHLPYKQEIELEVSYNDIVDIYNKIQTKFPNKFIKTTVINYIREELRKKYNLNEKNINYILKELAEQIPNDNNTNEPASIL